MALRKSQVLLPNIFQTTKNNKFLNATVDQLISEPSLQRVNSFIGRKFAPNFTVGDSYVQEIDAARQNYQLEPAVVYKAPNKQIDSLTGYTDFVNQLNFNNVDTNTHSDLFDQEYYNYSGFVDLDKLVNYGEYFWLPAGPDSVQTFNSTVDTEKDFTVTRRTVAGVDEYSIDNSDNANPTITLARGQAANPDFATDLTYKQIHNVPYSAFIDEHGGIDLQTEIDGKTLVFVNTTTDETAWDQGAERG